MRSLNEQLTEVLEKKRLYKKWTAHVELLNSQIQEKETKAEDIKSKLEAYGEELEDLHNFTFAAVISSIKREKYEKTEGLKESIASAKLQYQDVLRTYEELKQERVMYEEHLETLGDPHGEYDLLLKEKERLILDESSIWSEKLYTAAEKEIDKIGMLQELNEAVDAGEDVYYSLEEVSKALDNASSWSTVDMIGGGMVTTYMKHSRLDEAKEALHRSERLLRQFYDELHDIEPYSTLSFSIGEVLTAADYFFDGIIVDWIVHDKIRTAQDRTSELQAWVSEVVNELKDTRTSVRGEMEEAAAERIRLIQEA
ncbi:hypothetical protein [Alkalicoccus urumqiensis]|uniref:Uncharacterized protein n=1 Tax=Alkalicoccus urumqiensis TaxID=1548213 RepID=A0A2P6MKW1_ALKUR|nr:hypothetical protein [Alkalicoccus urumqiensis]PRO66911.1 hypothetical protein C6I21_03030 [Alkalicoccus urumqiensis]